MTAPGLPRRPLASVRSFFEFACLFLISCSRIGITCPAASQGNANYPITDSMTTVSGTCLAGYQGSSQASCSAGGTWTMLSSCTRKQCAAETSSNAVWPTTDSQSGASGTCVAGYVGNALRLCTVDGTWGPVIQQCTRAFISCGIALSHFLSDTFHRVDVQ